MGLLDSLIGAAGQALGGSNGAQGGGVNLGSLIGGLMNNGAVQGGLSGLLQQLEAGGLGQQVQSWISQGSNLPISADQITSALGGASGTLGQLAQQLSMSLGVASSSLFLLLFAGGNFHHHEASSDVLFAFHWTYVAMGAMSALAAFIFAQLKPREGRVEAPASMLAED